jgi:hypothetical protein
MKSDAILGTVLGALLTGMSVVGNVGRGDSHLVSVFPDLLSLLIAPVVLFILLRRRHRAGTGRDLLQRSGRIIVTISAVWFAVLLAVFAAFWFSDPSAYLIMINLAGTFVVTCIVGYLSVAVSARILTRSTE